MVRTIVRLRQLPIKAFTVLESLLVLMISSFILLALSSSVQATFEQIQAKIFFLEFEHFYQESQKLSVSSQRKLVLEISSQEISNGYARLPIPKGIQAPESTQINFDKAGGNSSLSKVQFQTKEGLVTYQLYIGNGKFKKTTNERDHLTGSLTSFGSFCCNCKFATRSNHAITQRSSCHFRKRRGPAGGPNGPPNRAGPSFLKWH